MNETELRAALHDLVRDLRADNFTPGDFGAGQDAARESAADTLEELLAR